MKLFKFFYTPKVDDQDQRRIESCLNNIVTAVSQRRGIPEFIRYDEGSAAFAGSTEKMELLLEISITKQSGKKYLCASLDDEVSWSEWDFADQAAFESDIIDYISNRVNRTVKSVIEKTKHQHFRNAAYYLDDSTGEWILFEDYSTKNKLVCLLLANHTKTTETFKTYKLDLR